MKKSLLILLSLLAVLTITAQQYVVYRVKGSAVLVVKRERKPLQKGTRLSMNSLVNLTNRSELKLFDKEHHEMVTLRGQCAGSLSSLIASQKGARQSMTQDYFAFIMKSMTGNEAKENIQAGRTTAIFRDDTDSLLDAPDEPLTYFPNLQQSTAGFMPAGIPPTEVHPQLRSVTMSPLQINTSAKHAKQ